eukprot:8821415-Karenia_brevis.AAC.1
MGLVAGASLPPTLSAMLQSSQLRKMFQNTLVQFIACVQKMSPPRLFKQVPGHCLDFPSWRETSP